MSSCTRHKAGYYGWVQGTIKLISTYMPGMPTKREPFALGNQIGRRKKKKRKRKKIRFAYWRKFRLKAKNESKIKMFSRSLPCNGCWFWLPSAVLSSFECVGEYTMATVVSKRYNGWLTAILSAFFVCLLMFFLGVLGCGLAVCTSLFPCS